jgi:hypothetical protein
MVAFPFRDAPSKRPLDAAGLLPVDLIRDPCEGDVLLDF